MCVCLCLLHSGQRLPDLQVNLTKLILLMGVLMDEISPINAEPLAKTLL